MYLIDSIVRINKLLGIEPKVPIFSKDKLPPPIKVNSPEIKLSIDNRFLFIEENENKGENKNE